MFKWSHFCLQTAGSHTVTSAGSHRCIRPLLTTSDRQSHKHNHTHSLTHSQAHTLVIRCVAAIPLSTNWPTIAPVWMPVTHWAVCPPSIASDSSSGDLTQLINRLARVLQRQVCSHKLLRLVNYNQEDEQKRCQVGLFLHSTVLQNKLWGFQCQTQEQACADRPKSQLSSKQDWKEDDK